MGLFRVFAQDLETGQSEVMGVRNEVTRRGGSTSSGGGQKRSGHKNSRCPRLDAEHMLRLLFYKRQAYAQDMPK